MATKWFVEYFKKEQPSTKAYWAMVYGWEIYPSAEGFDFEGFVLSYGPSLFAACREQLRLLTSGELVVQVGSRVSGFEVAAYYSQSKAGLPVVPEYMDFANLLSKVESGIYDHNTVIAQLSRMCSSLGAKGKSDPHCRALLQYLVVVKEMAVGYSSPDGDLAVYGSRQCIVWGMIKTLNQILGGVEVELERRLVELEAAA